MYLCIHVLFHDVAKKSNLPSSGYLTSVTEAIGNRSLILRNRRHVDRSQTVFVGVDRAPKSVINN